MSATVEEKAKARPKGGKRKVSRSGVARIVKNVKKKFAEGKFYEGEQMLKSVYSRMVSASRIKSANDLLYEGILTLFEHRQYNAGMDLLDVYLVPYTSESDSKSEESKSDSAKSKSSASGSTVDDSKSKSESTTKLSKERRERDGKLMVKLYSLIKFDHSALAAADSSDIGRDEILQASKKSEEKLRCKLVRKCLGSGQLMYPSPGSDYYQRLLTFHGEWLAVSGDFAHASSTLIAAGAVAEHCQVYHQWLAAYEQVLGQSTEDWDIVLAKERPLIRLRCTLQYLAKAKVTSTRLFVDATRPKKEATFDTHPVDNLSELLIEAVERKSLTLFRTLGLTYSRVLEAADPLLVQHFQNAGYECLGVPRPQTKAGGLGSLISSVLG